MGYFPSSQVPAEADVRIRSSSPASGSSSAGSTSASGGSSGGPTGGSSGSTSGSTGGPVGGHLIFATSQTYTGNLGGLAGADGLCQAAADAAGLSGSFVALLSTAAIDTNTRVTITGPVSKTTGDVVAVDSTDLWDGEIQLPIGHDENGTAILGNAWTGSHAGGTAAAAQCSDWVTENGNGRRGMVDTTGGGWFGGSPVTCGEEHRLYCIR